MRTLLLLTLLTLTVLCASGCAAKRTVVLHDSSDVVVLGPGCTGRVFVRDQSGQRVLTQDKVALPEGWYAGPLTPKEAPKLSQVVADSPAYEWVKRNELRILGCFFAFAVASLVYAFWPARWRLR